MRIGVHTGKIYAGIVGTEIVRYDVYGLDVLIANKMESHGTNG
jgi:class 3 adenylate cyclase